MDWATARPVASAAIAQLVEHFIRNEKVVGSSPTRGSVFKRLLIRLLRLINNLLYYEIVALLGL